MTTESGREWQSCRRYETVPLNSIEPTSARLVDQLNSGATDFGEKLRVTAGASCCSSENIWNNSRRMHGHNLATKLIPQVKIRKVWHVFGW